MWLGRIFPCSLHVIDHHHLFPASPVVIAAFRGKSVAHANVTFPPYEVLALVCISVFFTIGAFPVPCSFGSSSEALETAQSGRRHCRPKQPCFIVVM